MFARLGTGFLAAAIAALAFLLPAQAETPLASEWPQTCGDWDEWDKPGPPFRVFGNSYYVGTCGISAILIVGDEGHVLIDSGTAAGADLVAANIERLGFDIKDVKILLHSHEHHDHIGGMARLKELTGARLIASKEAAPVLESGMAPAKDPQFGLNEPFPAVAVDQVLDGDMTVKLGNLTLTALPTPGHTYGALSWHWQSCEGAGCLGIVYADSLTPVSNDSYRFSDHPFYVAAYRASLLNLSALDCGVLLAPHPSAAKMREKLLTKRGIFGGYACRDYAETLGKRLDDRLAEEAKTRYQ